MCEHPHEWRQVVSNYYEEPLDNAKERLIKTMFGCIPEDENPILWSLL